MHASHDGAEQNIEEENEEDEDEEEEDDAGDIGEMKAKFN